MRLLGRSFLYSSLYFASIFVSITALTQAHADELLSSPQPWNFYDSSDIQQELDRWEQIRSVPLRSSDEAPNESEAELPELETTTKAQAIHIDVFKQPVGFGVKMEFAVLSINGEPTEAYVISSAGFGHETPENTYSLKLERKIKNAQGKLEASLSGKPYPWHVSNKYGSSMYWGLQWNGPYWIHSTRDYDELGMPRSHGCIRFSFPAAMEIWNTIANQPISKASITTHGSNSESARIAWQNLGLTAKWVNERVTRDLLDAHDETTQKYSGVGHARRGDDLKFPRCGDVDCFDYFNRKKP